MRALLACTAFACLAIGAAAPVRAGDGSGIPAPAPAAKSGCIDIKTVSAQMIADRAKRGGRVMLLVDGVDQKLSDDWRKLTNQAPVKVEGVLVHGYSSGAIVKVDVAEFDEWGCAISRTAMPGAAWDIIMTKVKSDLDHPASFDGAKSSI